MKLVAAKDAEELLYYVAYWTALSGLVFIPSAAILVSTTRQSFLRIAWLPCWGFLAYHLCHGICSTWRSLPLRGVLGGNIILIMLNVLGLLVMRRVEDKDLLNAGVYKKVDNFVSRVIKTSIFFCNLRAIGTAWQVKIVSTCPQFLAENRHADGKLDRSWWVFRTTLIAGWQYLFLNLLEVQSLSQTPEELYLVTGDDLEWPRLSFTAEQWAIRAATALSAALGPTRVGIDLWYRLLSMLCVVSGLSRPEAWPPLFGTILSTSTIRGSWAGMTHRLVRFPLSTISDFIMRDLLGCSTKSLAGRCMTVILIFLISGLFHAAIELLDNDGTDFHEKWQIVIFWGLSAAGIIFEEAVQMIWRGVAGSGPTRLWQKVLGYVWVGIFFAVTYPLFLYPAMRQGPERMEMVPFDVVTGLGMPVAAGVAVGGGILLMLAIGGEV